MSGSNETGGRRGRDASTVLGAPLEDLARNTDPSTVVDFVAGLCAARGWSVERRGKRQLFLSSDDRGARLAVVHPGDFHPSCHTQGADRVVDFGADVGDVDAEVVDAPAIHRQLAYALDRGEAVRLLETHFGWSPDRSESGTPGSSAASIDGDGSPGDRTAGSSPLSVFRGRWAGIGSTRVVAPDWVGNASIQRTPAS